MEVGTGIKGRRGTERVREVRGKVLREMGRGTGRM